MRAGMQRAEEVLLITAHREHQIFLPLLLPCLGGKGLGTGKRVPCSKEMSRKVRAVTPPHDDGFINESESTVLAYSRACHSIPRADLWKRAHGF